MKCLLQCDVMPKRSGVLLVAVLGLLATACGDDDGGSSTTAGATTTGAPAPATSRASAVEGDITVFAAPSLAESFTAVGEAFTEANPDAKATFSFDASSALVQQITQGAPADVFAS